MRSGRGLRASLRTDGIAAPEALTRDRDVAAIWNDPDLLLGQTCGLPFVSGRCGTAVVIGRPDYAVEGAGGGLYRSALICRRRDAGPLERFRGARGAVNEFGSQSGCHALADAVPGTEFLGSVLVSGAHRDSALMVAREEADIAAVDAVAWALFRTHEPEAAAELHVVDWTRAMPALPYIASPALAAHAPAIVAAFNAIGGEGARPRRVLPAGGRGLPADPADGGWPDPGRRLAPGTPALPV